ncbi:leukocyte-associated immunoglobulin-like receptor 1 isoform X2 [Nycticebus coucang]|uniref:leukocyte-associated immunoglobulin-like receptor 1 isoform X2 n=1 Tax=Nycticebus coucang TaxID=9470 RepID=UPI00234E11D8|nr:leukocyte-associated immunoglobulin-like receptor 1 isoform X2 [Nycticebus coucang]
MTERLPANTSAPCVCHRVLLPSPAPARSDVGGACAMTFHPTTLLGLGSLPRISAEPSPVISQGQPVTIICRGPVWAEIFRLEKDGTASAFDDVNVMSQPGESETEARFPINSASEDATGSYCCLYHKKQSRWSKRSEILKLEVTGATQKPWNNNNDGNKPTPSGLERKDLYVLIGVSAVFLSCLFLLALLLHHQHQKKQGSPSIKDTEQKLQQRFNQAVDIPERKADVATADGLPEKDGEEGIPTPVAGDLQEVTYAQLDHWALTRRPAQAAPQQVLEPVAEFSTYAAVSRN